MKPDFISKKIKLILGDSFINGRIIRRGDDYFVKYNKNEIKCKVVKKYPNGYSILKNGKQFYDCYENKKDVINGFAGNLADVILFDNNLTYLKINAGLSKSLEPNYIYYEVHADGSQKGIYDNRTLIEVEWRFKKKETKSQEEKINN